MKPIPQKGKTYTAFDDGKISKNRLYTVYVKEVIPFKRIDQETLTLWRQQVKSCYWLFNTNTDYFIKTENGEDGDAVFVRTVYGGWFSLGDFFNSGLLDVDGKLTESLNKIK